MRARQAWDGARKRTARHDGIDGRHALGTGHRFLFLRLCVVKLKISRSCLRLIALRPISRRATRNEVRCSTAASVRNILQREWGPPPMGEPGLRLRNNIHASLPSCYSLAGGARALNCEAAAADEGRWRQLGTRRSLVHRAGPCVEGGDRDEGSSNPASLLRQKVVGRASVFLRGRAGTTEGSWSALSQRRSVELRRLHSSAGGRRTDRVEDVNLDPEPVEVLFEARRREQPSLASPEQQNICVIRQVMLAA